MPSLHHTTAMRSPPSGPATALQAPADPFTAANPPGGFASLLRQAAPAAPSTPGPAPTTHSAATMQAAPTPTRPSASPSTTASRGEAAHAATADPEAAEATDAAPASHVRSLLSARLRAAVATSAQRGAPVRPDVPEATEAVDRASSTSARDNNNNSADPTALPIASAAPIDPNILQWLAGLQGAVGPSTQASDASDTPLGNADGKPAAADSAPALSTEATHTPDQRANDLKAAVEARDKSAQGPAAPGVAADPSRFVAVLGEHNVAEKSQPAPTQSVTGNAATAAAAAAALTSARQAVFTPAAPVAVAIAAPVTAPEFAQVLGLQMSVLARDGVQRAELHLNPAEMGPVSVQIVMDGTQARVDFGADLAATRQAIEAGLPELASALRDAGFTLAGGGVSQHSGGRSEAGDGSSGGSSGRRHRPDASLPDDTASRVSAAARRIVAAGGVDLFA